MEDRKELLLRLIASCGGFRFLRWRHRNQLLVLTYHSVIDVPASAQAACPFLYRNSIDAQEFSEQVSLIKRHYRILSAAEFQEALSQRDLPERAALITFDDGLSNNATVAAPILEKLEVPALFFLPSGFIKETSAEGHRWHWPEEVAARVWEASKQEAVSLLNEIMPEGERFQQDSRLEECLYTMLAIMKGLQSSERVEMLNKIRGRFSVLPPAENFPGDSEGNSIVSSMSWDQVRLLSRTRMGIGAHTVRHSILSKIPPDQAEEEISACKLQIEKEIGQPCRFFSYPNGQAQDFSQIHCRLLSKHGYLAAFTQIAGFNTLQTDPFRLRRINIASGGPNAFLFRISGCGKVVQKTRKFFSRTPI